MISPGVYTLIFTNSDGFSEWLGAEVVEVGLPLIRVRHGGTESVINTGSSAFHLAERTGELPPGDQPSTTDLLNLDSEEVDAGLVEPTASEG